MLLLMLQKGTQAKSNKMFNALNKIHSLVMFRGTHEFQCETELGKFINKPILLEWIAAMAANHNLSLRRGYAWSKHWV